MTLHTIFCCHFGAKILQARFLQVDLFDWEHSSFFRCSSKTFFFQSAHLRDASSQALLTIHHKKMPSSCAQTSGHDSSLHDELRHWLPVISSPNFVFRQLRRQNAPLQTAMDKMHTMDSLLWATDTAKSKKKGSQNVHPAPKMRAKIQKKTPTCVAVVVVIASKKARTPSSSTLAAGFSIAGAHSALCFFPPPFTVVKETWQPVLPVYTSQKQAKITHVVLRNLAFKHACSLIRCLAARQPVSPACRSTQTTGLVTSIVVLSSHERHRHCVTREKNSFPFVLGTEAESPELFAILPAASAASSGATIDEA